jgi:hypothetical protein
MYVTIVATDAPYVRGSSGRIDEHDAVTGQAVFYGLIGATNGVYMHQVAEYRTVAAVLARADLATWVEKMQPIWAAQEAALADLEAFCREPLEPKGE